MPHIIACRAEQPGERKGPRENLDVHQRADAPRGVHARLREHLPHSRSHARGRHRPRSAARSWTCTTASTNRPEDQARAAMALVRRPHRQARNERSPSPSPANTPPCATPTPASSRPWSIAACHLNANVNFKWIDTTDHRPTATSAEAPRRRARHHRPRRIRRAAAPKAKSPASATPAKTSCPTWACASASRWPSSNSPATSAASRTPTAPNSTPDCPDPVIDILPEQKKIEGLGGNMRLGGKDIDLKPGTLAADSSTTPRRSACASATATKSIPSTSTRWKSTA